MATDIQPATSSKALWWIGCVLSALVVALLLFSASFKFFKTDFVEGEMAKQGWPAGVSKPIGVAELVSTVLYVIPQTTVLGAVLLTGYLGGATATHVHQGENILMPVACGVVVWLGLFFRDPRIRALLPWRS